MMVLSLSLFILQWASGAPELPLPDSRWADILNKTNSKIVFGVNLYGPSPYTRNNSTAFVPASNSKLFTAGVALEKFGPEARFKTVLEWRGVEGAKAGVVTALTLRGSGDPTWGLAAFGENLNTRVNSFADTLYANGVRKVYGAISIVPDDSRWNTLNYPRGWAEWVRTSCDGAAAQAFNLRLNCATYVVTGINTGFWSEPGVPTPVRLRMKEGDQTRLAVAARDAPGKVSTQFVISGTFNPKTTHEILRLPVHDTAGWVQNLLRDALHRRGIRTFSRELSAEKKPAVTAEFFSPSLDVIFKPFLKHSINTIGEVLFKALGAKFGPANEDLVTAGQTVLREYAAGLGSKAALEMEVQPQRGYFSNDISLWDGSGLSRDSQVTTSAVMALLLDLRSEKSFSFLWDALPIGGVDGTLKYRMRNTPAAGLLRGKTGTLDGVYNLSGYVPRMAADGQVSEYVPFVMLTRTTPENLREAHAVQDQLGAELARLISSQTQGPRSSSFSSDDWISN